MIFRRRGLPPSPFLMEPRDLVPWALAAALLIGTSCGVYRDIRDAARSGRRAAENAEQTAKAAKEATRGVRDVILEVAPYAGAAALAALGGREVYRRKKRTKAAVPPEGT